MTIKPLLIILCATLLGINAMAQGNNTRMGGDENDDTGLGFPNITPLLYT